MTTLIFNEPRHPRESEYEDVKRVTQACADAGYVIDSTSVCKAWEAYSESMGAGWVTMSYLSDEYLVLTIRQYCKEVQSA